ncbi:cysteine-rich and transmembrane domain-containing protein A [Pyrus ussuriensis x Pyrus communis]|uniref:Cysteine-rich and transmembrane domain-containing protein A n=1 Tax=Pyrus ussuriensis x Pyrus communis TaxID=2448454 RepID=A0A5N5G4I7_9ROSA|nr:cysteine-rich and transmembrane domain-containing protein A [Pyrus ussuriensis x Pyrus communis]
MAKTGTQENQPPPGYPTATENPPTSPTGKKFRSRTKAKGERGFIEGCCLPLDSAKRPILSSFLLIL